MALPRALIRRLGRPRARAAADWLLLLAGAAALGAGLLAAIEALGASGAAALRLQAGLQAALLLLLGFVLWRRRVWRPLAALRGRLRRQLRGRRRHRSTQLQQLRQEGDKRSGQLNAMLQLNRGMRDKMAQLAAEQAALLRGRDAVLSAVQDAVLATDHAGTVVGVSPALATLLCAPRDALVGKRFDDMVPLYQDVGERFRDHPFHHFIQRVLESGSTIPQIQQAVLVNHENEPVPVFLTAGAVLDAGGKAIGSTVRVVRADAGEPEPQRPTLSLTEAGQDWSAQLLSREPFERRLDELIAEAKTAGVQHMMLLLRVDDLGRINDEHGYWAGEQALWHAARTFAMALADAGTGYRYSNSRYGALLIGHDERRALEVAERVRKHAEATELVWEGKRISCTFTVAVVAIERDGGKRTQLLAEAENLLAQARRQGGNRVLHKAPEQAATSRRRDDQTWLDWLLPRLEDGRAHLISQELRALGGAQQPLVEFFLRVEDDDGVWLEPGYYLPAIERLRQVARVDLWVLQHLLDAVLRNPKLLETHALAGVNLSSQTLLDPNFAASAFEIVASSEVPAHWLCFEIDEAFALTQSSVVQRFMEQLRPSGVRFALDRCQTTLGMMQLRQLPVDYMKLHPSVTRNIETDALDRAHLEWVCTAARLLGRKTAAISVESESTLRLLHAAGVDYAQGSAVNKMGPLMT